MEKVRLATYVGWRGCLDPKKLAENMLYYQRISDHTRCFSCLTFIGRWDDDDIPIQEHMKIYPSCNFVNQLEEHGNVPIVPKEEPKFKLNEDWQQDYLFLDTPPNHPEEERKKWKVFRFLNDYYDFMISHTLPKPAKEILGTG